MFTSFSYRPTDDWNPEDEEGEDVLALAEEEDKEEEKEEAEAAEETEEEVEVEEEEEEESADDRAFLDQQAKKLERVKELSLEDVDQEEA